MSGSHAQCFFRAVQVEHFGGRGARFVGGGIGRPHLDPLIEQCDFIGGEFPGRGHLHGFVGVPHDFHQKTALRLLRIEEGAVRPALEENVAIVELQFAERDSVCLRVAGVAVFSQNRAYLRFEKRDSLRARSRSFLRLSQPCER